MWVNRKPFQKPNELPFILNEQKTFQKGNQSVCKPKKTKSWKKQTKRGWFFITSFQTRGPFLESPGQGQKVFIFFVDW